MVDNEWVIRFIAELMKKTMHLRNEEAFRAALQDFTDDLLPWVSPYDLERFPRHQFTMFESVDMTDEAINHVVLSPECLALFRAWLRRQGVDPFMNNS
jgi:hypothetical protein